MRADPIDGLAPARRAPSLGRQRAEAFGRHGVRTLVIGVLFAGFLSLLFGDRFGRSLLYTECMSFACWLFIDGSRLALGTWVHRAAPDASEAARRAWPGWPWMAVCLLAGTLAGLYVGRQIADLLTGATATPRWWQGGARQVAAGLALSLLPGIGISYFYYSRHRLQAAEARAEAARRQAAEHQLKLLESQLEPHMLFNTLANLRVLIALDPPRAQDMLDRLIAFLRATLGGSRNAQQPLSAEFDRLADYLALMQVRMGDRLAVRFDLPAELSDAAVPPLLLQPLVENSIRHALEPNVDGGWIAVSAQLETGVGGPATLLLRVVDSGSGGALPADAAAAGGSRFGLQQVRERLAALYGDAASMQLAPAADGGGMQASVRLPLQRGTTVVPHQESAACS